VHKVEALNLRKQSKASRECDDHGRLDLWAVRTIFMRAIPLRDRHFAPCSKDSSGRFNSERTGRKVQSRTVRGFVTKISDCTMLIRSGSPSPLPPRALRPACDSQHLIWRKLPQDDSSLSLG
jgi:hypothetical protein